MKLIYIKIKEHTVFKNSVALLFLQAANMLAPLFTFPYLSRVIGIEKFGMVMLAYSLFGIGLVIVDYGFNYSATYTISKNGNKSYVSRFIGAVLLIRLILASIVSIALLLYQYFGSVDVKWLMVYVCLNLIIQACIPTWFFHGIQKMKNITKYIVVSKLIFMTLVLTMINSPGEYENVFLFLFISNFFASIIAIKSVYLNGYKIMAPSKEMLIIAFKDSSQFFFARAAVASYTSANTFFVGSFSGMQQAAVYGASEKIYQVMQSITSPVSQALFPFMANKGNDHKFLLKVVALLFIPLVCICIVTGIYSNEVMGLVFGPEFNDKGDLLRVFLVISLVSFIGVNFGYPAFASLNKLSFANYTVLLGSFFQITCLTYLYNTGNITGLNVAITTLITELIVASSRASLYLFIRRKS